MGSCRNGRLRMDNTAALDRIASHIRRSYLGVGAEDHALAWPPQSRRRLLAYDELTPIGRTASPLKHIAAMAEGRPPANWACGGAGSGRAARDDRYALEGALAVPRRCAAEAIQ